MQVTYVGHATVLVEMAGTLLVVDPVLRRRVTFLRWHGPEPPPAVREADAVLVTHLHHDHCDLPSLRALGRQRTLVVPAGSARFFRRRGFRDVTPLAPGTARSVGGVTVTATRAIHDGRRLPFGPRRLAVGYVLAAADQRLYVAGDTALFPEMVELGPLDVALLPVAGWGRSLGPGHMDPAQATEAASRLRPSVAIPIHWGTLRPLWHRRPGASQTDAPALQLADDVAGRGLGTTVAVLQPGQSVSIASGRGSLR